jgi:DNA-nicking Smr family endonuclease
MCGRNATFSVRPFEKLKKNIESKTVAPALARQKKKEEYTDEELFDREMDDVAEIEAFRALSCGHAPRKTAARPAQRDPEQATLTALSEIAGGRRPIHLPDTQEYIEWANPEYNDTILPKLHEGLFAVQAFLDLHGCTVAEAGEELDSFVQESFRKGLRCVKIIHGRGLRSVKGARIKQVVVRRLSGHFRRDVIAFVTARQCDGGLGALYVLLKKKRARP